MAVQGAFTLFCLYAGYRFHSYFLWMTDKTDTFTPKPPSVEAFLPISALMAAKRFFMTGQWDTVHPAGLTIFFAILLTALLFRKGFCGYICPVGFLSALLERLGQRTGLTRTMPNLPHPAAVLLRGPKYLLLAAFLYFILIGMPLREIEAFLASPYNLVADAKMLAFFTSPSRTSLIVLAALAAFSLVLRNAWCRFLCPYGALLGLLALASPVAVSRDAGRCISCRRCTRACPSGISVDSRRRMDTPECIGCAACAEACPVPDCLSLRAFGLRLPVWSVALGSAGVLFALYLWAVSTGHWVSDIPPAMLRRLHIMQFGG
ncbi:hypothetical protein DSM19430T_05490 [Desulfovibrio psychrotolerans]|uniref:4Fe-4S ferredoxin-type domain-containing protein n=2 Tax=Desulfovibrio psychrotolerans TaxID=415242 RepID=A0A7J0BRU1_9BACT|nr:hypothetical protein DSM19430T_05490 [Desulfovibrio psychrotolerans]